MMMQNTNDLAKKIWGKDATEVMDFLHKENLSIKDSFRNEETMMNYIARILIRHCNKRIDKSYPRSTDFWEIRGMSIQIGVEPKSKAKNILYIIRLLTGKLPVPSEYPEPEYDFETECLEDMEEESFWEDAEKKREAWIF